MLNEDQEFSVKTSLKNIMPTAKFDGSDENTEMYKVFQYEEEINPKIQNAIDKMKNEKEGSPAFNALRDERLALEKQKSDYIQTLYRITLNLCLHPLNLVDKNPIVDPGKPKELQLMDYRDILGRRQFQ